MCAALLVRQVLDQLGVAGGQLDNLVFVVNCNLQRLDGPVRGNGHIVDELETLFAGAGWNVIKCLWGSNWDPLLARDKNGALRKLMMDTLDGDYQAAIALPPDIMEVWLAGGKPPKKGSHSGIFKKRLSTN